MLATKTVLIKNTSFVVGYENGGHYLLKNGQVAYQGNTVTYVGKNYAGPVDETIDAKCGIVIPGLINCHVHVAASPVEKGFLEDLGSPAMYMTSLYEYMRVTLLPIEDQLKVFHFSLAEIMTKGTTTFFELGQGSEEMIRIIGESGMRCYVAPRSESASFMTKDGRTVHYEWDEPKAYQRLEEALRLREQYDGSYHDRIRIALYPGKADTCTPNFLREVKKASDANGGMLIATHAAQTICEYQYIVEKYGMTPADYLTAQGIAGPNVLYGHYIFPRGHHLNAIKIGNELKTIAENKTNVVHCPWVFGRRGQIMESLQKYLDMGINMCIGTDTFPQDMLHDMRCAAVFCKIAEGGDPFTGTAATVFNMATLGGAKALGRDDLGRLCPGAKADIVIIDTDNIEWAPLRDPIKVLVYTATSKNIAKVIVDGDLVAENGVPTGQDIHQLCADMQAAGERMWANVKNRDWAGRTDEEICPMSFPLKK